MRVKALVSLRSRLLKPCRKLLPIFKFNLKKPVYIRAPKSRPRAKTLTRPSSKTRRPLSSLFRGIFSSSRRKKTIRPAESSTTSFSTFSVASEARAMKVFPSSPLLEMKVGPAVDDVSDDYLCRSFENYLAEMIVEEGKLRDLTDVEELLFYWKSLNCPVFVDLVTRFYGELCKDLFSSESHDYGH